MNKCPVKNVDIIDDPTLLSSPERPIYTSRSSTDELDIEDLDSCTKGTYSEIYETFPEMRRGGYGVVCKARNKITGEEVITKFIYKNYIDDDWYYTYNKIGMVPKEIGILLQLDHPNIIKLYGFYQNKNWYQVVMEKHGPGIDLYDFTDRLQQPLAEDLGSYIFQQVVSAVRYLHERFLVHRDIKDENIIIDERFHAKLVDFGSATHVDHFSLLDDFEGTTKVFSCPEYLRKEKYDGYTVDIWALGVTLYLLMYGDTPFETEEEVVTFQGSLTFPEKTSGELRQLLQNMLNPFPQDRYTIKEVYNHTWTTQAININKYIFEEVICVEETNWDVIKPEQYYTPREENFVLNLRGLRNYNSETDEEMEDWITVSEINSEDYENEQYYMSDQILDDELVNTTETPTLEDSKMSTDTDKRKGSSSEIASTIEELGVEQGLIPCSNTMDILNDSEINGMSSVESHSFTQINKSKNCEYFTNANKLNNFFHENHQTNDEFLIFKNFSSTSVEFVNDIKQKLNCVPKRITASDYFISNGHLIKKNSVNDNPPRDLASKRQQLNRTAKSLDSIDENIVQNTQQEETLNPKHTKHLPKCIVGNFHKTAENNSSCIITKKSESNKTQFMPKFQALNYEEVWVNNSTQNQEKKDTSNVKNQQKNCHRNSVMRSASTCQ